jgi:hypothetical protein
LKHICDDTPAIARRQPRCIALGAIPTSLACAVFATSIAFTALAHAAAEPPVAGVVWTHGARVYVTTRDSLDIAVGDTLTFVDHGHDAARGAVSRVYDDGLCLVTLDSGSLDRVKHPERLRIRIERPPIPIVSRLRLGMPSPARECMWFSLDPTAIQRPPANAGYRSETVRDHLVRMVRDSALASRSAWPETLLIRAFDDAGDEEIALERDEIDVALFWPGELSSHIRDQPRWQQARWGTMTHGLVAALWPGVEGFDSADARLDPSLTALAQDLFRDDLTRWGMSTAARMPDTSAHVGSPYARRFEVDPACPGRITLERFLNRASGPNAGDARAVHVFFLDANVADADSVALAADRYVSRGAFPAALRAYADQRIASARSEAGAPRSTREQVVTELADSLHVTPLFSIRCPVLCVPKFERAVDRLGADAFVALFGSGSGARRP